MRYREVFLLILLFFLSTNLLFAQKDTTISFARQNKKARYYSFSAGMGLNYCDNKSLKTFVEYELPFYNNVPANQRLATYYTGIEFFGGAEFQISKKLAIKGEYSYFSKSYNSTFSVDYANREFTYYNHQPFLTLYYLIPQQNSFIKIGAGGGYLFSNLTKRIYGAESNYYSTGLAFRLSGVLDIQMGKSLAGYVSVFANKTFQSDLKDRNGNLLRNSNNETVNLNSFGVGVRLGIEFFIF